MITLGDLMPVLEGLAILPNAPKIQDGHLQLYLKLLNERSVEPPPMPVELQEAALDVMAAERFFPPPAVLIEAIKVRRDQHLLEAKRRIADQREGEREEWVKKIRAWSETLGIEDATNAEKAAEMNMRMPEFEEIHGVSLHVRECRVTNRVVVDFPRHLSREIGPKEIGDETVRMLTGASK